MTVSIIIPAYNASKFIERTIDSILAQSYSDIEIIVIDDASTDDTLSKILKYKQLKIITHENNKGTATAINTGLCAATGKYVMTLAADDILYEQTIELLLSYIFDDKPVLLFANAYDMIDSDDHVITNVRCADLSDLDDFEMSFYLLYNDRVNMVSMIGNLASSSVYEKFDESKEMLYFEDTEWLLRMVVLHKIPVRIVDIRGGGYRVHKLSKTSNMPINSTAKIEHLRQKVLDQLDQSDYESYMECLDICKFKSQKDRKSKIKRIIPTKMLYLYYIVKYGRSRAEQYRRLLESGRND